MSLSLDQLRVTSFETGAAAAPTLGLPTTTHGEDCFSWAGGCPTITWPY